MTKEEVLALAQEAKGTRKHVPLVWQFFQDELEYFAALIESSARFDEREECAKVAKQWDVDHPNTNYGGCIASLIRSRE